MIRWKKSAPWLVTIACFVFLYVRIDRVATHEGFSVWQYLVKVFGSVDWVTWLAWMIPYSIIFFLIDTLILWRCINWWNAVVPYKRLLPVRASSYIISIINEQVGKGGIALYLNRRDGVSGWELGSTMLVIMTCEFLYLLAWATIGATLSIGRYPEGLESLRVLPWLGSFVLVIFAVLLAAIRHRGFRRHPIFDRAILSTFRKSKVWQYGAVMALRSPALLAAVFVYSKTLSLFGVNVTFIQMLCVLPIVFFGTFVPGPFRAVAVSLWPTLFSDDPGVMAVYGFVQHNCFILFNAIIGLVFLPRAYRELFGKRDRDSS